MSPSDLAAWSGRASWPSSPRPGLALRCRWPRSVPFVLDLNRIPWDWIQRVD
jgi:hypothetical protein